MTVLGYNVMDPLAEWPAKAQAIRLWDCGVTWKHVNPAQGLFDWSRLDAILDAHPRAQFTYVLSATPQWAAHDPLTTDAAPWLGQGSNSPPRHMADWEAFVRELVLRYKGRMHSYQVWNEPQLAWFWAPYSAIGKLGQMTKVAASIIRRLDSAAMVVGAPVLTRRMLHADAYQASLAIQGWPIDAHAAHVYPSVNATAVDWAGAVRRWKRTLVTLQAPRKRLWVTETNFNLGSGPLGPRAQANRVHGVAAQAEELGIHRLHWYAYGHHGDPKLLGVQFWEGSPGAKAMLGHL